MQSTIRLTGLSSGTKAKQQDPLPDSMGISPKAIVKNIKQWPNKAILVHDDPLQIVRHKIINGDFALFPGSDLLIRAHCHREKGIRSFLQPCVNRSGGKPDRRLESNSRLPSSRSLASMLTGLAFSPRPVATQAPSTTKPGQSEPNRDEISMSSSLGKGDRFHKLRALSVATASELPSSEPSHCGNPFFGDSHTGLVTGRLPP